MRRFSLGPTFLLLLLADFGSFGRVAVAARSSRLLDSSESEELICNSYDPNCGDDAAAAQLKYLTSYDNLVHKLHEIASTSKVNIQVGPLIQKHEQDGGLFNIDVNFKSLCAKSNADVKCDVCGPGTGNPSVREAVVCSVTNDPLGYTQRGNTNPSAIGQSTQGRDIMAARIGNFNGGIKTLIVSQLHGTEAGATESLLEIIEDLSRGDDDDSKILDELDILFVVRANPDGGEPTGDNLAPPAVDYFSDYVLPPLIPPYTGKPKQYDAQEYFFRHNVDNRAGGNFGRFDGYPFSEDDFFGIVGRGYDLNRYCYYDLKTAIRPVESQALVALLHVWQPKLMYDMHGDVPKTFCELDQTTIGEGALFGFLPEASCAAPVPDPTTLANNAREYHVIASLFADTEIAAERVRSQKIASEMARAVDGRLSGVLARFSQTQFSVGATNNGGIRGAVQSYGGITNGAEVRNMVYDARPAFTSFTGKPSDVNPETTYLEACFLPDEICLHTELLWEYLKAASKYGTGKVEEDDGFCSLPTAINNLLRFPSDFGWIYLTTGDDFLEPDKLYHSPGGGQYVPAEFSGVCPLDPGAQ